MSHCSLLWLIKLIILWDQARSNRPAAPAEARQGRSSGGNKNIMYGMKERRIISASKNRGVLFFIPAEKIISVQIPPY